jgi:hypothetical protein
MPAITLLVLFCLLSVSSTTCASYLFHLMITAGTLDPEQLADADSKFMRVNGIQLHYKDITFYPGASSSSNGSTANGTSASSSTGSSGQVSDNGHAPAAAPNGSDAAAVTGGAVSQPQEPLTLLFIHGFNGWVFNWRMAMPGIGNMVAELGRWVGEESRWRAGLQQLAWPHWSHTSCCMGW